MNWDCQHERIQTSRYAVLAAIAVFGLASPVVAEAMREPATSVAKAQNDTMITPAQDERDYRVTQILGMDIYDRTGVDFGRLQDIVLNMSNGDVLYAIISLNGETALDQTRYYAIPAKAFTMQGDHLLMSVNGDAWHKTGFPANHWPSLSDPGY